MRLKNQELNLRDQEIINLRRQLGIRDQQLKDAENSLAKFLNH